MQTVWNQIKHYECVHEVFEKVNKLEHKKLSSIQRVILFENTVDPDQLVSDEAI